MRMPASAGSFDASLPHQALRLRICVAILFFWMKITFDPAKRAETLRMVIVVWTPTEDGRRIISMRKANDREQARYSHRLG
jgi:ribosomal protein L34